MGRKIDISNLSDEDVPFLIQRPWIAQDALHQGYDLPDLYYETVGKVAPKRATALVDLDLGDETPVTGPPLGEQDPEDEDSEPEDGDEDEADDLEDAEEGDEPEDAEDEEEDGDPVDYSELTKKELQAAASERGLETKGNVADLVARLQADDEAEDGDDA